MIAHRREDIATMYSSAPDGWPAMTSEESLRLWDEHTDEFLAESADN